MINVSGALSADALANFEGLAQFSIHLLSISFGQIQPFQHRLTARVVAQRLKHRVLSEPKN